MHDKWVLPTNTWATANLSIEVKKNLIMHATSILVTRESKTYQACLRVGTVGGLVCPAAGKNTDKTLLKVISMV